MEKVYFTATALPPTKKGIVKKDDRGYYEHPVGALDVFNTVGEFYTARGAKELFEQSSHFMRRVKEGVIYGENGHPVPLPGQNFRDFYRRAMSIDEKSLACHFRNFWLDFDSCRDDTGRQIVVIMANVKPFGPYASSCQEALDNPDINSCFSIRSVTDDKMIGNILERRLKQIVTFDLVVESGVKPARKFRSPALESYTRMPIHREELIDIVRGKDRLGIPAMEAAQDQAQVLLSLLGWNNQANGNPAWANW